MKTSTKTAKAAPKFEIVSPIIEPVVKAPRAPRSNVKKILGVVAQVKMAFKSKNRLATTMGFLLGGFVPVAIYLVAHYEVDASQQIYSQLAAWLVLGGLVYSAKTVYDWGTQAFKLPAKALGFVLLMEGVMVTSHNYWLGLAALSYLVVINGIATGCSLALEK